MKKNAQDAAFVLTSVLRMFFSGQRKRKPHKSLILKNAGTAMPVFWTVPRLELSV